jgi:ATP-dependent exoDNAse (exonuclease V) alpha subunit
VLNILESDNIFLTGGAGVGKSYMTKEIVDHYKSEFMNVVVLGSTGISAVNVGGQTIHSFFVFGIAGNFEELKTNDRYNKSRIRELNKILEKLELLVIDEISMVSADLMDMILYRLRGTKFRGRVMVVGDFYQLPPVRKFNTPNNSIFGDNIYAFESSAWENLDFTTVELKSIKRTSDKEFMSVLNAVRVGEIDNKEVLDYLIQLQQKEYKSVNATVLYGRNAEADRLNISRVASINLQEFQKDAIINIKDKSVHEGRINSWKKSLPIMEKLTLKEGIPIIFTTNKWGAYHNGERAIVEHIDEDSIVVEKDGKLLKVERYDYELSRTIMGGDDKVETDVICTLSQFPIRLAYAITIHKSQGMSLDDLICNVDNIFADSQFYVALSRAIDPNRLKIEYTKGDFVAYLHRVVRVSDRVKSFYSDLKCVEVD